MTCQPDSLARVRARVVQGLEQGFSRSFPRLCKGCKGYAQSCLTYVCVRARLCAHVRLHKTLATLATLASNLSTSFRNNHLGVLPCARVRKGSGFGARVLPASLGSTSCCPSLRGSVDVGERLAREGRGGSKVQGFQTLDRHVTFTRLGAEILKTFSVKIAL